MLVNLFIITIVYLIQLYFVHLRKVIEILNKAENFALLSNWISKASLMKGAPTVSVKPIQWK